MAYDFRFPDVGEGIHEGEVVRWKVKEGDKVTEDQVIAEVQTDKALVEIPSPKSGIILKRAVAEGQKIRVNDVFCIIGEEGDMSKTPKIQKNGAKNEVKPAPAVQPVTKVDVLSQMRPVLPTAVPGKIVATPRTRQLARSLGVDMNKVTGTGVAGRITDEDVQRSANGVKGVNGREGENETKGKFSSPGASLVSSPAPSLSSPPSVSGSDREISFSASITETRKASTVTFEKWGSILRIPLKGIRRTTAEHMARAWAIIPHVTHMDEVDVSELAARREKEKMEAEKHGYKLTYLPFITKAVIAALRLHPYFNCSLNGDEIIVKKYYNIGIAVDTSNGVVVPNIKNAEKLSILELAREMQTLAEKCRDGSITLDEMQGGTFTITNIGSLGGIMATPIINHPEAAILGVGAIREKAVVRKGKVAVRKIMPLFLSFDHRVIDGAAAAKFVNDIIRHLEDPDLMLVDVA